MLRGIGIEFRSYLGDGLWAAAFDFIFSVASVLLAIFFGRYAQHREIVCERDLFHDVIRPNRLLEFVLAYKPAVILN